MDRLEDTGAARGALEAGWDVALRVKWVVGCLTGLLGKWAFLRNGVEKKSKR